MKTSILFTMALGLVLAGCSKSTQSNSATDANATPATDYTASTNSTATATTNFDANANRTGNDLRNSANSAAKALGNAATNVSVAARMAEWKLNPSDIQDDLNNDKNIIRTKESAAGAPTGTADKSVVESMVKGRLEADSDLSALKLRVSADRHGEVTLKGKAHSADEVGRAVALALDTEGVAKVTSKIRLDKDAKTNR